MRIKRINLLTICAVSGSCMRISYSLRSAANASAQTPAGLSARLTAPVPVKYCPAQAQVRGKRALFRSAMAYLSGMGAHGGMYMGAARLSVNIHELGEICPLHFGNLLI